MGVYEAVSYPTAWSSVGFVDRHLQGRIWSACGNEVLLEAINPHATPVMDLFERIPVSSEEEAKAASQSLARKLMIAHYETPTWFTNNARLVGPGRVEMKLDAWDSAASGLTAFLDLAVLPAVAQYSWGVRQVEGKPYAFSPLAPRFWLHNFILDLQRQHGLLAQGGFVDGNSLNYCLTNLRSQLLLRNQDCTTDIVKLFPLAKFGAQFHKNNKSLGQWVVKWKVAGGRKHLRRFGLLREDGLEADTKAKARAEEFHSSLLEQKKLWQAPADLQVDILTSLKQANEADNDQECADDQLEAFRYKTRNVAQAGSIQQSDSAFVGPFLRGVVRKHGQGLWCVRWGRGTAFSHFDSEKEAQAYLLNKLNIDACGSLNSWRLREAQKIREVKLLTGAAGEPSCVFTIDDDSTVAEALQQHLWCAQWKNGMQLRQVIAVNADPKARASEQHPAEVIADALLYSNPLGDACSIHAAAAHKVGKNKAWLAKVNEESPLDLRVENITMFEKRWNSAGEMIDLNNAVKLSELLQKAKTRAVTMKVEECMLKLMG